MRHLNKRITPDFVSKLSRCEIFVFGSNLQGEHRGGAARMAYEAFGAVWGQGVGRQGCSYAIPTMFERIEAIKPYVDEFVAYARNHPRNRFLLTRIGCGIAGFKDDDMVRLFAEAFQLPNVSFPKAWIVAAVTFGMKSPVYPSAPAVVTEHYLKELCERYNYEIGAGITVPLPDIRIRYVKDENTFGYARMGDFFFYSGGLYVFDADERWKEAHEEAVVLETFGDECWGRGYARRVLFAGVRTPFRDRNGEQIYTGDLVQTKYGCLPVSTLGGEPDGQPAQYVFALDNHCIRLSQVPEMVRVGTLFYELDRNEPLKSIQERCNDFLGLYGSAASSRQEALKMAKQTPCFKREKPAGEEPAKKTDKIRLSAIGEHMVVAQLLQQGWNAINANLSIRNCKAIDMVCIHPETKKCALVQVKTSVRKGFPTGFSLAQAADRSFLEQVVLGPWVFVYAQGEGADMRFRYFILSQSQLIDLLCASHDWYLHRWPGRKKAIRPDNVAAIPLKWLEGEGEALTEMHEAFVNPLAGSSEDQWEHIWAD